MTGLTHSGTGRRGARGLTLVEMCLAIAVLAMVAASIATIFIAASDLIEKGRGRTELVQAGRAAMNRLLAELRTTDEIEERSDNYLCIFTSGTTGAGSFARRVELCAEDDALWRQVEFEEKQALAEQVTSFWTGGLTLWSKLDGAGDVTDPQVGPAGYLAGVSAWRAVHFGLGCWSAAGSGGRVFFPASSVLDNACGTLEFWLKPDFSAEWRGLNQDKYLVAAEAGGGKIALFFDHSQRKLVFQMNGSSSTQVKWEPTWAPGEVVHVALVWDCTGRRIGDGRTMALYVNGLLREETIETTTWTPQDFGPFFSLGEIGGDEAEAAFDNLRAYDYCKTDFRDRYREQALGLMRVRLVLTDDGTGESFTIESGVLTQ